MKKKKGRAPHAARRSLGGAFLARFNAAACAAGGPAKGFRAADTDAPTAAARFKNEIM